MGYTDKEGPHPYETCIERLRELIRPRQRYLDDLNERLEYAKRLVNEKGQRS